MKSLVIESMILGSLIYFGLSNVDLNVTINVTDKPIVVESSKEAR